MSISPTLVPCQDAATWWIKLFKLQERQTVKPELPSQILPRVKGRSR